MRLDGRKYIQSVKSSWLVLHADLKAGVLHPLYGKSEGRKMKTRVKLYMYIYIYMITIYLYKDPSQIFCRALKTG